MFAQRGGCLEQLYLGQEDIQCRDWIPHQEVRDPNERNSEVAFEQKKIRFPWFLMKKSQQKELQNKTYKSLFYLPDFILNTFFAFQLS